MQLPRVSTGNLPCPMREVFPDWEPAPYKHLQSCMHLWQSMNSLQSHHIIRTSEFATGPYQLHREWKRVMELFVTAGLTVGSYPSPESSVVTKYLVSFCLFLSRASSGLALLDWSLHSCLSLCPTRVKM